MTDRRVDAFVEAILADRPAPHFRAVPDDTEVLRVALQLRAGRSEFAGPDPDFVEQLHRQLATTTRYAHHAPQRLVETASTAARAWNLLPGPVDAGEQP